jgi:hypothetical protein
MQRWILAAAAALLPQLAVQAEPLTGAPAALHVLNRIAYGPRPGDVERVTRIGVERYIDEQLAGPPMPPALAKRLAELPSQQLSTGEALAQFEQVRKLAKDDKAAAKEMRQDTVARLALETAQARLLRAVDSARGAGGRPPAPAGRGDGRLLVQPLQRLFRQRPGPRLTVEL